MKLHMRVSVKEMSALWTDVRMLAGAVLSLCVYEQHKRMGLDKYSLKQSAVLIYEIKNEN